jgi:hypothetical protein
MAIFAVPKCKQVAASDSTRRPSFNVPCEGPLGHTAVSLHKVPSVRPLRIRILGEHGLVRRPDGALSFMSFAVHVVAGGSLEDAVLRHHGHEGLDVMTVPGDQRTPRATLPTLDRQPLGPLDRSWYRLSFLRFI